MDTETRRRNLAGFASLLRAVGAPVPPVVADEARPRTGFGTVTPEPFTPPPPRARPKWTGFTRIGGPGARLGEGERAVPIVNPPPGYGQ
jgi:hypothetical protein